MPTTPHRCTSAAAPALVALVALAATASATHAAPEPLRGTRMNVVFAMADQLRHDVGALNPFDPRPGGANPVTPHLRRLMDEGVTFAKAYTSTPTCTPARSALLTGQSPWGHGMLGYGVIAQTYPFEMPRAMDAAGYQTVSIGKDHFGGFTGGKGPVTHGYSTTDIYDGIVAEQDNYHTWFEGEKPGVKPEAGWPTLDMNSWRGAPYVFDEFYHPTAWVGRAAVDFIGNYSAAAASSTADPDPFFLKVSFHRPHSPYDPPQRVLDTVAESDLPPIVTAIDGWDDRFRGLPGDPTGCGPQNADAWCGLMPSNATMLARRAYYASASFVDEQMGHIVAALNSTGLLENTLVLFTADHGDGQADHYHWRKGYPYELSAHIPMIMRWPEAMQPRLQAAARAAAAAASGGSQTGHDGDIAAAPLPRGSVLKQVTELRDVFPTVLDAAGASSSTPANYSMHGTSLLCLVADPTGASCNKGKGWRPYLDLEHDICYNETMHWNALTDGDTKFIFRAFFGDVQLFNLTADPGETQNLAGDPAYAHVQATWYARMVQQFEDEGRGPTWVKGGVLQKRVKGQLYSPNYPKQPPPARPAEWP